ncbi:unnamed protein product [Sphagnum balticum]
MKGGVQGREGKIKLCGTLCILAELVALLLRLSGRGQLVMLNCHTSAGELQHEETSSAEFFAFKRGLPPARFPDNNLTI